jgi:predicted kinase
VSKLIIMKGLPACGKSTMAETLLKASGNMVRVNKDLLRTMLHFDKWNGKNEDLTSTAAREVVAAMLRHRSVVVDDTNLNPGVMASWKAFAQVHATSHEVLDMTDVSVETCVERDLERSKRGERSVGYSVIRNMALRYGLQRFDPSQVVLCDLDGTIADITHRLHYVKGDGVKDWKGFFEAITLDSPRESVCEQLAAFRAAGKTIIIVSARPDTYGVETRHWLARYEIPHWTIIMRSRHDHRQDVEVKADLLKTFFPDQSVIHAVVDDRPSVIRMWREQGLNVIDVGAGVEF